MHKNKPIIFRSLIIAIRGGVVTMSFDGVDNLLINLSFIVEVSQCKASNPLDTFETLVGAGFEVELNKVTRAALDAAALFASIDLSPLDAFLLGERNPFLKATREQASVLFLAAASFGYTEAVLELIAIEPTVRLLFDDALSLAARCGRTETVKTLLIKGAATTAEDAVIFFPIIYFRFYYIIAENKASC